MPKYRIRFISLVLMLMFLLFFIGCYEEKTTVKVSKVLLQGKSDESNYNLAEKHFSEGNYDQALVFYFKQLEEDLKYHHDDSLEIAVNYNDIGLAYDELKNYTKALEYYQKTMKIDELRLEVNSTERATTYFNIASVYDALKNYPEAIGYYEKALEIDETVLESNDENMLTYYEALAEAYGNASKPTLSLLYLKKALDFKEQYYAKDDPRTKESRADFEAQEKKTK